MQEYEPDSFEALLQQDRNEEAVLMSNENTPQQLKTVYGSNTFDCYLIDNFLTEKYSKGISTYRYTKKQIWIRKDNVQTLVKALCEKFGLYSVYRREIGLRNEHTFVAFNVNGGEVDRIDVFSSDEAFAKSVIEFVNDYHCVETKISVRWIYGADGSSMELTETFEEKIEADLYPFIKDYDTYNERYIESKSNILLLIGPPGTGKTTFIKALLAKMNTRAYLTYDEKILANDYTFASYMGDDSASAFVIEDADLFLRSRADGNGMVSRFLNVGDGIIKLPNKKLIFSTNLPNINDIDSALIRPGRCFDVLHFRNLTRAEATVVADNRNILLPGDEKKEEYTLAEVFNNPVEKPAQVTRKFGFY